MNLKFIFSIVAVFIASQSIAQSYKSEFGLQADNDSFLGQGSDRYYTNGLFINFNTALKIKDADTAKLKNKILGFEVGQKLYNPQNGHIPGPTYIDRPFAGYLYAELNLNLLYANESNLKLGAQVGVIGPGAAGEEVQTFIHNTFGFYHLDGWEYEIHDGAQLNLSAEYNKLLYRQSVIDASLTTKAALGNGFTGASAGLMFRAGNYNQLYSSVSTQSTVSSLKNVAPLHQHEFFGYYKPAINYVAYDATIQGSLFNKTVYPYQVIDTKKPFIFSNQVGGAYTTNHWVFDASVIFNTHATEEQHRSEQWGVVAVYYRY